MEVGGDHFGPALGQHPGDGGADTAARAGHQGDPAGELGGGVGHGQASVLTVGPVVVPAAGPAGPAGPGLAGRPLVC
ncbi:hypothetical protein GCM10010495_43020 [Kitasatospora herbaricolor]|nr:hypothetical protein GCM10010495_43020 [Kitasatospora herbaricolor]